MNNIYAPCLCGSEKKFKFCCQEVWKKNGIIPATENCSKFPIHECKIFANWKNAGITNLFISRELSKDSYVVIGYLVDLYCLGLKDTTFLKFGVPQRDLLSIYGDKFIDISYQDARSLILGAIDFAKTIDIAPHASWKGIASSFIEAQSAYEQKFSFGKEGKPFYIVGPYDHEYCDTSEILEKVAKAGGHYLRPVF